jgi:hypothetical protein
MRRVLPVLILALIAAAAVAGSRKHHRYGHFSCGVCVTPLSDDVTDCSDLRVILNDRDAVQVEEIVPVEGVRALTMRAPEAGGIYVHRSDNSRYTVKVCKAAEPGESLSDVRVRVSGDEVSASGPGSKQWIVNFIVGMPRGARADFGTSNGPIAIFGVDGTVTAHAENGPISLKDSIGTLRATAENGPIQLSGSAGDVTLRTDNGPISVELGESSWTGRLDAHTDNGPVDLTLPRGYRSGVTVDTDGNSPVKCHAEDCRSGRVKFDDDDMHWPRHIDLGTGAKVVSVGTHNGPVSISEH